MLPLRQHRGMISLFPDSTPIFIAAIISVLGLRQLIFLTLHHRTCWTICYIYALGCVAIPLLLPLNFLIIGASTIYLIVRRINHRDDPRFAKLPPWDADDKPDSN